MRLGRGIVLVGLLMLAARAWGQWDQVTIISPDSFYNAWPQIVVDDSLHLHVFCARGLNHVTMLPSSLFYLKFDSWGNLLSGPTELWPSDQYRDYSPGVLLDRNNVIHLVWSRERNSPFRPQVIYARMTTNGEFLTPPTVIDTTTTVQQGMNLVQASNGDVWGAGDGFMCAFHENGEQFVPLQTIFPGQSSDRIMYPIAATGPDGHVYASIRYVTPGDTQCIIVTRLDTSVREATVISPGTSPSDPVQMGAGDFFIDSSGIWHSTIGRDDNPWVFYQRTAPDGTVLDTLNWAMSPDGWGPFWELVGEDTLVKLYMGQPAPYLRNRVGFLLNGSRAYEPIPIPVTPAQFRWDSLMRYVWKAGSYWIVGLRFGVTDGHHIAMIHVPGPNEPPNAVDDRRPAARIENLGVSVYPNPAQNELRLQLSSIPPSRVSVKLLNILGQEILSKTYDSPRSPDFSLTLPSKLPSGSYYGLITAGHHTLRFTFTHL